MRAIFGAISKQFTDTLREQQQYGLQGLCRRNQLILPLLPNIVCVEIHSTLATSFQYAFVVCFC
jgi:hypothetical protein